MRHFPSLRLRMRMRLASSRDSPGTGLASPSASPSCPICLEEGPTPSTSSSSTTPTTCSCTERTCRECMTSYIAAASTARRWPVLCPGDCGRVMRAEECLGVLEGEKREELERLVVEKDFHGPRVRYCCNRACSAPYEFNEEDGLAALTEFGGLVKCPLCSLLQCARCGVEAHFGRRCVDVGVIGGDVGNGEGALGDMAAAEGWRRCPGCATLCSKEIGCNHCVCVCCTSFCFQCGVEYASRRRTGAMNENVHGLPGCSCSLYTRNS